MLATRVTMRGSQPQEDTTLAKVSTPLSDLNATAKVVLFLQSKEVGYTFTCNQLTLDYNTDPAFDDTLGVNNVGAAISNQYKKHPGAFDRRIINKRTQEREYVLLRPELLNAKKSKTPKEHNRVIRKHAAPRLSDTEPPAYQVPVTPEVVNFDPPYSASPTVVYRKEKTAIADLVNADPVQVAMTAVTNALKHYGAMCANHASKKLADYSDEELTAEIKRRLSAKKQD